MNIKKLFPRMQLIFYFPSIFGAQCLQTVYHIFYSERMDKSMVRGPENHSLPIHNIVTFQCNSSFQLDPKMVLSDSNE